ncbi:tRNA lysidine(34) synthetase TilS [bacterium]|nr:MAG: tRNA lysidine(34) synthetase TilS [bacterium]
MRERLSRHLAETGLIPEGSRVLLGYSGGADSTCLLHLLAELGIDVVAAHLHHGMRPEADREQKLCEATAESLGVPFATGRADVPRLAADRKIGLEEAGREARYGFFRQAASRLDCTLIATAHTRDDQVETVLFRIARGTGLAGLAGIPQSRDGVVRPLLPFSRAETRAFCDERGLWFHDDPANLDRANARVRVRLDVVPALREINSGADAAIVRLAAMAEEEDRFLDGAAAAALERAEVRLNGELAFLTQDVELAFDRRTLEHLPAVLLRRAVRLAAGALGAELDFDGASSVLRGEKGSLTAEGGEIVLEWDSEMLHGRVLRPTVPFRYPLTLPGETESEEFGWRLVAYPVEASPEPPKRAALAVEIDRSVARGGLHFRGLAPGDTMRPLGFNGTRKLSDLLSEAGLTPAARARLPIVCDMVGPLWAPGVCLDERARPKGGPVIALKFEGLGAKD